MDKKGFKVRESAYAMVLFKDNGFLYVLHNTKTSFTVDFLEIGVKGKIKKKKLFFIISAWMGLGVTGLVKAINICLPPHREISG